MSLRPLISIPPIFCFCVAWLIGKFVGDVTITPDEIKGLMADLLYTNSPPAGKTRLTDWIKENSSALGVRYSSELARR